MQVLEDKLKQFKDVAVANTQLQKQVKHLKAKVEKRERALRAHKDEAARQMQLVRESCELELFEAREETEKWRAENEELRRKIEQVQAVFGGDQNCGAEGNRKLEKPPARPS